MELQYKQQPLHNNFMGASYAAGGLQSHTWEFQWGPQGLEQAIKRIGMSPVITQNFSTDPMGRPLSMTYNGPSYSGELYFHYDVQGNTSLLTDSNGQAVASFRYDLHNGRIAASWNPNNLEIVNLKGARQGSIRITTAVTGFNRDLYIQPWPPIEINPLPTNGNGNGGEWGGIGAVIGGGAFVDMSAPDTAKDCGDDPNTDPCDPKNLVPESEQNDQFFKTISGIFNQYKDKDCDELEAEYNDTLDYYNDQEVRLKSFNEDYTKYDPWRYKPGFHNGRFRLGWIITSYLLHSDDEDMWMSREQAVYCHVSRFTIARLQMLDCLKKLKDC